MFTIKRSRAESLCETCTHGCIMEDAHGRSLFSCGMMADTLSQMIPQPVKRCTAYEFRYGSASHEDLMKAWILETKGKVVVGFKPPKGRGERE